MNRSSSRQTKGIYGSIKLEIILIGAIIFCPAIKGATEYTQVPIKVNVLKGVTITDTDIENTVTECNKILKQANVQLRFDPKKDINRNVSDTGNDDGIIQSTEETKLDEEGKKELDKAFGASKGMKIYFTNKIGDSNSTRGLAPHAKEKDGKLSAKPMIYLKNLPTVAKELKGNDLAHESCHVMTLGKNHMIDKTKNKRADDTWHDPNDPNNLMYPYNPRTVDGKPVSRGSTLTDDQKKEIQKGAKRLGMTKVAKTTSPNRMTISEMIINPLPTIHGGFVDEMGETPLPYLDLGAGILFAETPSSSLEISLLLEGIFPPFPPDVVDVLPTFAWYFNTDNDEITGDTIGNAVGVDKILYMDLYNLHPGTPFGANLYDVATYTYVPLVGRLERIAKLCDGPDTDTLPEIRDAVDGLYLSLPLESLQLSSNTVPVCVVSENHGAAWGGDIFLPVLVDEVCFTWQLRDSQAPQIELVDTLLEPGNSLELTGWGFTAGDSIELTRDNEVFSTVSVEPDGTLQVSVPWSSWHPSEILDPCAYYFIGVRDNSGNSDFTIVEVRIDPCPDGPPVFPPLM